MKVILVSPATIAEFGPEAASERHVRELAEHVPVGVLTLTAILLARGVDVRFADMNALYDGYLRELPRASFAAYAATALVDMGADVIGLGTLSSSYPLTLRVTTALKDMRPGVLTLLGGPQATAVDGPTLREFPAVDLVLRGEADESLAALLGALAAGRDLAGVAGLSYRSGGEVVHAPSAPVPLDLDAIPLPAYDLFPALRDAGVIPLEIGRGCPYGCTFCSTNEFFRRRFRLKSPGVVLEQMQGLSERYGITRFDFVHDMLTVDRRRVVELCEALIAAGASFEWNCSARTDRVDDELLDQMVQAGCRGIFFGIEAGSPALQRTIKKRLDLSDASRKIEAAARRGMTVVTSLITGFPEERPDDLRQTVDFFVRSLRHPTVSPQLHILAPLAGSPIHAMHRADLRFDDIVSDMSHCGWAQDPDDWRRHSPAFQEPQLSRNLELVELLRRIGARHGRSPGEVAIAWTLRRPEVTGAIVGARSAAQVDGWIQAMEFRLGADEIAEIERALGPSVSDPRGSESP